MKETEFQSDFIALLKGCNCEIFNVHGHMMQAPGWPDLYVAHPHCQCWLELKVGNNTCSKDQAYRIKRLVERRVLAAVVTLVGDKVVVHDPYKIDEGFCVLWTNLFPTNVISFLMGAFNYLGQIR